MAYQVVDSYGAGVIDGKKKVVAEIYADSTSDLPAYNNCKSIDGELYLGSVALVVKDGELYALATDNKWYKQSDGTEVTTS